MREISVVLRAQQQRLEGHRSSPSPRSTRRPSLSIPPLRNAGECHQQIYEEWSSSQHAYASISPMFHKFEQKFQELTQGTVGTFCVRCHQQVGTQPGEARETPLWARSQISREGVSCITCHRVKEQYGKVNGERRVEPGKIYDPVYGSGEKSVIKDVLADKETYSVKTSTDGRGNDIHNGMITNPTRSTKSEFCVSCHQVAVNLGIKLEIVWDQYRDSPARKAGVTLPGLPHGQGARKGRGLCDRALRRGRRQGDQPRTPGTPITASSARAIRSHHPGIFPLQPRRRRPSASRTGCSSTARRLERHRVRGQGRTTARSRSTSPNAGPIRPTVKTPARSSKRISQKLDERDEIRQQVMENSSHVDGPFITGTPTVGQQPGVRLQDQEHQHGTQPAVTARSVHSRSSG